MKVTAVITVSQGLAADQLSELPLNKIYLACKFIIIIFLYYSAKIYKQPENGLAAHSSLR